MPGQPQLRESALLYRPDDPDVPVTMVRLEQQTDGAGLWVVLLNSPAAAPTRRSEHPDEQSARNELERLYAEGRQYGQWKIRAVDPY
ncbi:hypothetical protein [Verrucosispora sp. WMMD1129]|uniref:hypothetical protein n=1 Tax=Verrucosispora sp. WMMD1129 TaxID=3016093 RepID=UPI00249CEC04|nr:hypothetical protein [Verrucosispora sp. WMMD1129]WFE45291.1 hypothetical protein O7624_13500 [Verrucosispora sp. WMMD1129]